MISRFDSLVNAVTGNVCSRSSSKSFASLGTLHVELPSALGVQFARGLHSCDVDERMLLNFDEQERSATDVEPTSLDAIVSALLQSAVRQASGYPSAVPVHLASRELVWSA